MTSNKRQRTELSATELRRESLNALRAWLLEKGAVGLDKLDVRVDGDGELSVHALTGFAAGDAIAGLPAACVLTAKKAKLSPVGQAMVSTGNYAQALCCSQSTRYSHCVASVSSAQTRRASNSASNSALNSARCDHS
jgi:hypothetical protein